MPITIYVIVNVEHTDRIIEGLRFVFIELPKFKPKTIVEKSAFNDAQLYAYEQFWDAVYVEKALIEGGYNKGRVEERIANAKALLDNGVPLKVIVKSLHLTDDEAAMLSCP